MGFLDVQIPDWLKPQSPAEQSNARDRAILTGMEIGARAATQRASQEHDLAMRRLQMGQQLDEFNQRMSLERDEFNAKKSIQDLQLNTLKQEAADTPVFASFLEQVAQAKTPDEVMQLPAGKIMSPKLAAQAEAARLARVNVLNTVKATSAKEQTRASWIKFGESISNRHLGAGSGILSIATKNGDLTPDDITKMQEFVNVAKADEEKQKQADFANRMAIKDAELKAELEREIIRQKNKGKIERELTVDESNTYREMIKGVNPNDLNKINEIRSLFNMSPLVKKNIAGEQTATGEAPPPKGASGSFFDWLNGKAAGGATEPPAPSIPQVPAESPVSVGGGVIGAPVLYDPATKTFKVQTAP